MRKLEEVVSQVLSEGYEKPRNDFETKAEYLQAARLLLGSYRTGDANDPEVYVAGVVRILSAYPMDVVRQIVDPLGGLPGKLEWLPKFNEIKSACEEIYGPVRRILEWDREAVLQLQERDRLDGRPVRSAEEIQAALARDGIKINLQREQRHLLGNSGG